MTNVISSESADPRDILLAWMGSADLQFVPDPDWRKAWFFSSPEQDNFLAEQFGHLPELAVTGGLDTWDTDVTGRLALVILCDQLPRNMFRGTARAFSYDPVALSLALDGITRGMHLQVGFFQRQFFILPLEHAEVLDIQDQCVAESRRMLESAPPELREDGKQFLEYADIHRDFIQRFGRFPHRNRLLDRCSTPEEIEFLEEGGPSFGQK